MKINSVENSPINAGIARVILPEQNIISNPSHQNLNITRIQKCFQKLGLRFNEEHNQIIYEQEPEIVLDKIPNTSIYKSNFFEENNEAIITIYFNFLITI